MAPLAAPRSTVRLNDNKRKVIPVAAGVIIFQGSLVATDAGFAVPASADADLVVQGHAAMGADNRAGTPGGVFVEVERGVFAWDNDGADPVTQAQLGKNVFAVDDQTVAATDGAGTRPVAGTLYQLDDAGVWVETK